MAARTFRIVPATISAPLIVADRVTQEMGLRVGYLQRLPLRVMANANCSTNNTLKAYLRARLNYLALSHRTEVGQITLV